MLSKEEIEQAKNWLSTLETKNVSEVNSKVMILSYIEQLESDRQKLIDKLEKRRKQNNNRYGQAIDNDEFPEMYEHSGQVKEDDYILKNLKREKE